jgi:hypothetical protein
MKKEKHYRYVKFSPEAIQKACSKLESFADEKQLKKISTLFDVKFEDEKWSHDTESEFFADYTKNIKYAVYRKSIAYTFVLHLSFFQSYTDISIEAPKRSSIEEVHQIFTEYAPRCVIPKDVDLKDQEPIIFIGHGQSTQWRDLKDHLHDKHDYPIEAYEIGARAGHAIRDILEKMLDRSSFAILVMTGEDKDEEGNLHARDNVIHELGLFQGKLGFPKAIVLLEEGTQEFSNIHGMQQIRYSKGNIKETFGEILATLKREFEQE